jgi:hypothetical protein
MLSMAATSEEIVTYHGLIIVESYLQRRYFRVIEELTELGTVQSLSIYDNRIDLVHIRDIRPWVSIQQDQVGRIARLDAAHISDNRRKRDKRWDCITKLDTQWEPFVPVRDETCLSSDCESHSGGSTYPCSGAFSFYLATVPWNCELPVPGSINLESFRCA